MVIIKIAGIILAFFLFSCVKELCRVFNEMRDEINTDSSYVAVGILAEITLIVIISIKVITG